MLRKASVFFVVFGALGGCVNTPHPGVAEGGIAPRIELDKHHVPLWRNVESFGPVRTGDAEHASAVCATLNSDNQVFEPRGYHSRAIDVNGVPFAGGGYYCVGRKRS